MDSLTSINELFPSSTPLGNEKAGSVEDMGSDDFLTLMVAQLENQDPSKPMDNMQFMGQLAQFGTVSGIQELNEGFSGLSNALSGGQALQAASLVGRSVVTDSNLGSLSEVADAEGELGLVLDATVEFGGSTSGGNFFVQDLAGRLVYSSALPPSAGGQLPVRWDGRNAQGELLPPGTYRVSAEAVVDGQSTAVSVYAHQRVDSVAVDGAQGAVTLNLANGSNVALEQVKQFL
ncbi:flagellar hook capping FlgD N-terminal domain-containing protein [Congregibacter variabilis]|uniref:Basal-body rod modification protein FlgD n=1 Tax=Congregibacter variabilis TaxID=3081200 RepID=A0ABZ0I427_9GAMM|nr:flagellar hook capping FlgD N-terminal domain-containing protein [Congregibacter sp. IMCC43200]